MRENFRNNEHYIGHRTRLRNRFIQASEGLQEYEIVELLLTYVIPQRDVKAIAKELLKRFGSIKGIFEASEEELKSVPYIKDKFIALLKLIREVNVIYKKQKASELPASQSIEKIAQFCIEKFGDKKEEEFHVLYLDSNFKMQIEKSFPANEFYIKGTVDKTIIYPRQIIEEGIKKKAYAFIIVHNHPNGSLQPSEYDKNLTKLMDIAAKSIGMILFDHFIVTSTGYFSFKQEKLL